MCVDEKMNQPNARFSILVILLLLMQGVIGIFASGVECNQTENPFVSDECLGQNKAPSIDDFGVKKVSAKGIAKIFGGNIEIARKVALRAAYAEAVSQGGMIEVGSMSLIKNVKQVSDVVRSRSRGFIRNLKIVNEGLSEDNPNMYEVFINAEVISHGRSYEDDVDGLQLFLDVLGNPTLLIIFPEFQVDADRQIRKKDETTVRRMEPALGQAFSRFGYQIMTSEDLQIQQFVSSTDFEMAKEGVPPKIIDVARSVEVDLVLYGVMTVSQEITRPGGVELVKIVSEASGKAVIVSSGRIIDTFHQTNQAAGFASVKAYADCIAKAAQNIADSYAWKIPQILADSLRETRLILNNVDIEDVYRVKNALIEVYGIESIRMVKMPMTSDRRAEMVLSSAYIVPDQHEVFAKIEETLNVKVIIERVNKFSMECRIST